MDASFKWHNATITVRAPTVRDELEIELLGNRFIGLEQEPRAVDITDFYTRRLYARFLVLSSVTGDIGFGVPAKSASDDDLMTGLLAYSGQPSTFLYGWRGALDKAETPPNDADLTPLTPEKKD